MLGRIAAQTAKQVIFQKVREAERENIFAEYSQRIGEVVNATVKRFENGDMVVELGRIEASLPRKEQSRAESYAPGERVRAVIKGVNRSAKGPQIVLSRTDPALLIKLFEQEVPEIYDGTVHDSRRRPRGRRPRQGRGVLARARRRSGRRLRRHEGHARAGDHPRAARREDRHRRVVRRPDRASSPTRSARRRCSACRSSTTRSASMEVVVEDKQLSLAIGKKGQNVRLAAKLTGWRIDIKSEEEKRREVEAQFEGVDAGESSRDRRSGRRARPAADERRPSGDDARAVVLDCRRRRQDDEETDRGGVRHGREDCAGQR